MSTPELFNEALREWMHVFFTRSTHDLVLFLKDNGITMGQYSVLMHLHHGSHCGVSNVGSHLGITNAAASQLVDKLVQQGLLERSEDPHDRRVRQLALTGQARELVQSSIRARLGWTDALFAALDPERSAAVVQALKYLATTAQALEQPELPAGR